MRLGAFASVGASAALVLVWVSSASAQALGSQRSFDGLFGGAGGPDASVRHSLNLSLSLSEAYDSDTPLEARTVIDPTGLRADGFATMFSGAFDYTWQGNRVQFGATGSSAARYENETGEFRTLSHTAGLGFSARLAKTTTLLVNQTAAYSPWYLFGLFPQVQPVAPGDAMPAAPDYALSTIDSYSYGTTVSVTGNPTPRNRLSAAGEFSYTDFQEESAVQRDTKSKGLRVSFSRNLAASTALNAAYRYRTGNFGYVRDAAPDATTTEHGFDFGMEHSRRLSATRRAYISLGLGTSTADIPSILDEGPTLEQGYRLTGSVAVGYDFGRSWQARANYRRGLEFLAGLIEPVYTDAVSAVLTGLLSPRVDVTASTGYSSGEAVVRRGGQGFETYAGSARARVALTRTIAAHAEYLLYFYDFGEGAGLLPDLPQKLTRHGVRVGLTLWVPVLRR